jgi:hypothetical protein
MCDDGTANIGYVSMYLCLLCMYVVHNAHQHVCMSVCTYPFERI